VELHYKDLAPVEEQQDQEEQEQEEGGDQDGKLVKEEGKQEW